VARSRRADSGRTWSSLSPGYRARLKSALGEGAREKWLAGADLRSARSHKPAPPVGAAPRAVTERVVAGEGSMGDLQVLRDWQAANPRGYYYSDMDYELAAVLSQIRTPPEDWAHVHIVPRPNSEPWTVTVTPKGGGYTETVDIPGGGAEGSPAREFVDYLDDLQGEEEDFEYDVTGTE
jgi:hypothetical protein